MSSYSHYELTYARPVANAILNDREFRNWLLKDTPYADLDAFPVEPSQQRRLRSPNLKNPYWFNYWCGKDKKCLCREAPNKAGIETDILLVFDCSNGKKLCVHIEIKPPGEKLLDGQAESYPRRAACWANPATRSRRVPAHDQVLTMLVCGSELKSDERLLHFDKVIVHDDIAERTPVYPEPRTAP